MWAPLALALGGIAALLVVAEVLSLSKIRRLQVEVHGIVRNAERSTFLIGDLGHRLSRMQSNVLEALTEPPGTLGIASERLAENEAILRAHADELPQLLSAQELELWRTTEPQITEFMSFLKQALEQIREGRTVEAEIRLDELAARTRQVFDALEKSMELNQRETLLMVATADQLIARARLFQIATALLLFAAILAIGWKALRVLRRREREVAEYLGRIELANRDLEAFAGRVAHDLRNVLSPLQYCGNLLALSGEDPKVVEEAGLQIQRLSRRATDLISGLLAFARAGEPSQGEVASVDRELAAVLEELAPLARSIGAEVQVDVEPGLLAQCEESLLHVILLNLLSNAVKFLVDRPQRLVSIRCRLVQGRCSLEVEDTGPGIPSSALGRIFEPYFRAPEARVSGEGIGLATVSRIVEAHQGEVQVHSTEGVGTTFRVLLPGKTKVLRTVELASGKTT